jgi:hypothetical protein
MEDNIQMDVKFIERGAYESDSFGSGWEGRKADICKHGIIIIIIIIIII